MLHAVHEHAYFKWADGARVGRTPKCVGCSGPLVEGELADVANIRYRGLSFCSASCLEKFTRDVSRSTAVMPS